MPPRKPVKNYGVWAAVPKSFHAQTEAEDSRSPHITLNFDDGSGKRLSSAINVKSISKDARLVYWFSKNFNHPITDALSQLELGFHPASVNDEDTANLTLDFQRQDPMLLEFSDGRLLPHELPGADNDVLDYMDPLLTRACKPSNKIYIFGSSYGTGIHDVHMNQGSLPQFENGIGQDGALIIEFDDGHYEAVFLAFANQKVPTDDDTALGTLPDSQELSEVAKATTSVSTAFKRAQAAAEADKHQSDVTVSEVQGAAKVK